MTNYELTVKRIERVKTHLRRMRMDSSSMTLGSGLLVKCSQSVGTTKEGEFTLSNQRAANGKLQHCVTVVVCRR